MVSVTMPQLGESVTEGTVTRWLKAEGDTVAADEPLLEVSTDKVDTEIPSPVAGILTRIVAGEDAVVPVGGELAVIGEAGEAPAVETPAVETPAVETPAADTPGAGTAPQAAPVAPEPPAPSPDPSPAAPAAAVAAEPSPPPASGGAEPTPVLLPALGESVTEGTVTRWLKAVGDQVTADEPLLEVSTDKVDTEIPSPTSGILLSIEVPEDSTVEVGGVLGLIGSEVAAPAAATSEPAASPFRPGPSLIAPLTPAPRPEPEPQPQPEPVAAPAAAAPEPAASPFRPGPSLIAPLTPAPRLEPEPQPEPVAEQQPAEPAPAPAPAPVPTPAPAAVGGDEDGGDSTYVTPLVRKLAAEHNVDLSTVTGSGVGGRIRKQDVLEAAAARSRTAPAPAAAAATPTGGTHAARPAAPSPSPLRGRTEPMSRLRKVIAERMTESLRTSAQLTTVIEVDVTRIAALRQRAKNDFETREGVKLSFLPFFAKATVEALKVFPNLNASIDGEAGTITYHEAEHLGVAVDTERGLLVPVIRDAGDLNIAGLARKINDLADRTRNNKILPDELSGGTFTLTNTGSRGALFDTPIINQPQVGILGTGAVVRRPVVVSDETGADVIAVRSMVYLAMTYDHRLVDGADAARFLSALKSRLEEGNFESDLGL